MDIAQAQSDVRRIYREGALGPLVSSVIWFAAVPVASAGGGPRPAIDADPTAHLTRYRFPPLRPPAACGWAQGVRVPGKPSGVGS